MLHDKHKSIKVIMAKVPDISPYLDEKSTKLWEMLNSLFSIDVFYYNSYKVYAIGNTVIMFVPSDSKPCAESFAHELLHLYVRSTKTYIDGALSYSFNESSVLSSIFSEQLIQHVANTIEHVKMYPIYLEMGYDKKLFISDFDKPKLTSADIVSIRNNFRKKGLFHKVVYKASAINSYIGKFFAAKACPNPSFNYSSYLRELLDLDSSLYVILDEFWQRWLDYDIFIEHRPLDFNYNDLCFDFHQALKQWAEGKRIRK